MNNIRTGLFFAFLLAGITLNAQQNQKITDSFVNVSLQDFFERLEKKTSYKFYYDPAQLKSFYLSLEVKDLTIAQVLQEALKATDLRFSIDNSTKSIFVTIKFLIETELPAGYFKTADSLALKKNLVDSLADFDIESKRT